MSVVRDGEAIGEDVLDGNHGKTKEEAHTGKVVTEFMTFDECIGNLEGELRSIGEDVLDGNHGKTKEEAHTGKVVTEFMTSDECIGNLEGELRSIGEDVLDGNHGKTKEEAHTGKVVTEFMTFDECIGNLEGELRNAQRALDEYKITVPETDSPDERIYYMKTREYLETINVDMRELEGKVHDVREELFRASKTSDKKRKSTKEKTEQH